MTPSQETMDFKQLVDPRILPKTKTPTEAEAIKILGEHCVWMAQTVHQAYHQDIPGPWRNCPRDICSSTMYILCKAAGEEPMGKL